MITKWSFSKQKAKKIKSTIAAINDMKNCIILDDNEAVIALYLFEFSIDIFIVLTASNVEQY